MKCASSVLAILFLALFLNISGPSAADAQEVLRQELEQIMDGSQVLRTKTATEVTGSPYFNTKFVKGEIILNENSSTQPILLRYNMEDNMIEFRRNNETLVTDAKKISGFKIYTQEEDIIFKNGFSADVKGINQNTLLRVVYNGNIKLLAHHSASLKEDLATYATATKKSKYVQRMDYYLVKKGKFHKVKLRKKDIMKHLSASSDDIESYVEENGLGFESETDLKKILNRYDGDSS